MQRQGGRQLDAKEGGPSLLRMSYDSSLPLYWSPDAEVIASILKPDPQLLYEAEPRYQLGTTTL
jgi:hypothetical protein